jgi:hypothetical protein
MDANANAHNVQMDVDKAIPVETKGTNNSAIWCLIIGAIICYTIWHDYKYYVKEDPEMVTTEQDFHKFCSSDKYAGSKLFHMWQGMDHKDEAFLSDYMAHCQILYKKKRPDFQKRWRGLLKQLGIATAISCVVFAGSPEKLLKQNTVNYFVSSMI